MSSIRSNSYNNTTTPEAAPHPTYVAPPAKTLVEAAPDKGPGWQRITVGAGANLWDIARAIVGNSAWRAGGEAQIAAEINRLFHGATPQPGDVFTISPFDDYNGKNGQRTVRANEAFAIQGTRELVGCEQRWSPPNSDLLSRYIATAEVMRLSDDNFRCAVPRRAEPMPALPPKPMPALTPKAAPAKPTRASSGVSTRPIHALPAPVPAMPLTVTAPGTQLRW
jgi:hypothetical protein